MELRFQGDGKVVATDATWVVDSARLVIDAPAGAPLEGEGAGLCGTNGWNRITAIYFSADNSPLPADDRLICTIPLRVSDKAQPGRARISLASSHCVTADVSETACELAEGWVDVRRAVASPAPQWATHETLEIIVRLREGDAAQALRDATDARENNDAAQRDLRDLLDRYTPLPDNPPQNLRRQLRRPPTSSETIWYREHPDMASAQLHLTMVAGFKDVASRDRALETLKNAAVVEWADIRRISVLRYPPATTDKSKPLTFPLPSSPGEVANDGRGKITQSAAANAKSTGNTVPQDHLGLLRIGEAWKIAEGWGLVGIPDTGIYPDHPEFKSFSGPASIGGTFIPGGNYLPALSENVAGHGQAADNLDEFQYSVGGPPNTLPPSCDPPDPSQGGWQDGLLHTDDLFPGEGTGHGTHVAGLIAANSEDGSGVSGGCKHCGMVVIKWIYHKCDGPALFSSTENEAGFNSANESGAQVINSSGGDNNQGGGTNITILCGSSHNDIRCTTAKAAFEDDIYVSAASGNNRDIIQAPANGVWSAAIGGLQQSGGQLDIWDKSPGSNSGCPFYSDDPDNDGECGSNFGPAGSTTAYQELMALSSHVMSTVYPAREWGNRLACGDSYGGGASNDGIGECTGTSMSAPQVSAIVGLIRSINPLVPVGAAKTTVPLAAGGIRKLLADTASRAQAGQGWDYKLGFGIPDAEAAARGMLGVKRGERVRNRAIPLFSLRNAITTDTAAVATPQMAMSLNQYGYVDDGPDIPSYPDFPNPGKGNPGARAYVLSTQVAPDVGMPAVIPLFLLMKDSGSARDYILLSDPALVQSAVNNQGYGYLGRQGYVYRHCAGIAGCTQPVGTQTLNLKCKAGGSPCAVFTDGDSNLFQNTRGFNTLFPGMSSSGLGYAYARGDTDGDGLPNAMEWVLGTLYDIVDTDGDGINDGVEYPFANIPNSDPCDGPMHHRCTRSLRLFDDGFEEE
ncbi:MAG: S8 family serine peptidase [Xanthomonadales bacterium]|nr:S8 family serine peptidase [Xanthomonadales bacterium]